MTDAQCGHGSRYSMSDYDTLSNCRLDVLKQTNPNILKQFQDAPIVIADKIICDCLNVKITSAFVENTNQEMQVYHSHDHYKKALVEGLL